MKTLFAFNEQFVNEALASVDATDVTLTEVKLTDGGLKLSWVNIHDCTGGKTFTESELIETHFNHLLINDAEFNQQAMKFGVTFAEYYKAYNTEVKIQKQTNLKKETKNFFTELLEMMCDGKIPFKTDADIKSQKNENAKRNAKKAEEKKAKDKAEPLPEPETIDGSGLETKGVDIPGETKQDDQGLPDIGTPDTGNDEEITKETGTGDTEPVKVPKGFKRTKAEKDAGLTPESAFIARNADDNGKTETDWL